MMRPSALRRPAKLGMQQVHLPAPMGGLNTLNAGTAMPPADCLALTNMVASDLGLRARLGWREWCTNLGGLPVRSLLPFTGSHKNGSTNKLFACTAHGIWDVSSSSASPSEVLVFTASTDDSGWGNCHVMVTAGGHFLLYCDEENGYHVWSESTSAWIKPVLQSTSEWIAATGYLVGDYVLNSGNTYICTTAGTSAGSGGPTTTGTGITDGGCVWDFAPSLTGVDPANLAYVVAWKSKVWLVEKDTARAWYLATGSIYGTATSFNFGQQFRAGGPLVGLWNWTLDGGFGIDDYLVGISGGGDIAIYQGTDPSSATTFGLKGTWSVGALPFGRKIATDFGGDLLILSADGLVPLSKLVSGDPDKSQYATEKVSNLVNQNVSLYSTNRGWALRIHPLDHSLMVLIPVAAEQATSQLIMSLATKAWSQYADLPIYSAESWGGSLYFGTADGRVCINDGYVDGVTLADPSSSTPIQWSLLTAFQNLDSPKKKRVDLIRPLITSQSVEPNYQAEARFDFDLTPIAPVAGASAGAGNVWDSALWDSAVWQGDYVASQRVTSGVGMGSNMALAIRGTAISKTILVGVDVGFTIAEGML